MAAKKRRRKSSRSTVRARNKRSATGVLPPEAAAAQGKAAETAAPPTPPASRGRRLKSLTNIRRALADVVRGLEDGTVTEKRARALVYGLSQLASLVTSLDLEARLAALEQKGRP